MSHTGGLDKAVLEAMACGVPIITCNETFDEVLGSLKDKLMFKKKDSGQLANRIESVSAMDVSERTRISRELRSIVVNGHNLSSLINKIINIYKTNGTAGA